MPARNWGKGRSRAAAKRRARRAEEASLRAVVEDYGLEDAILRAIEDAVFWDGSALRFNNRDDFAAYCEQAR